MSTAAELETLSYWEDSTTMSRYPALDRDLAVDVVIIGAGITGLTAAYLLKQSGRRVAVIDRRRCGGVDSAATTAHVTCVTDTDLTDARPPTLAMLSERLRSLPREFLSSVFIV